MSLICPACQATYNVDPALLGEKGRKVRCASCGNTWMALPPLPHPPGAEKLLPPEPKEDPDARLNIQSSLADWAGPQIRVIPAVGENDFAARVKKADAEEEPAHKNFRPIEAAPKKPDSAFMILFHQFFIPASLLMFAIILGTLIMARSAISKRAPGAIAVYNLFGINPLPAGGGLAIMNVHDESRFGQLDNALVIHGDLVNRTSATLPVPLFKMEITAPNGQTKTFMARGPIDKIEGGAVVPFTLERAGFAAQDWDVKLTFGDGSEHDSGKAMQTNDTPPAASKEQK